ncbi:hypothetical protein ACFXKF_36630 [Streptomyces scopuliridis]|uniref:hypothetical protein n=1 Tax=Streptomyces scopuliridis TaxID=452529 RepID=UPI00367D1BAE
MHLFTALGTGIQIFTLAALFTRRIGRAAASGLMGASNVLFGIAQVVRGESLYAAIDAGLAAYFVHDWWHRGGGDGTRRRLRRLRNSFRAARRTAPTAP